MLVLDTPLLFEAGLFRLESRFCASDCLLSNQSENLIDGCITRL